MYFSTIPTSTHQKEEGGGEGGGGGEVRKEGNIRENLAGLALASFFFYFFCYEIISFAKKLLRRKTR